MQIKAIPNFMVSKLNTVGSSITNTVKNYIKQHNNVDEFINQNHINKNTIVGAAVVGAATILAIKAVKGIIHTLKKIKEED